MKIIFDKDRKFYQKRYEQFVWTLKECGVFLINEDDDTIKGLIFEGFDIDFRCNLSDIALEMFMDNNMIYEDIRVKSVELRNKAVEIFNCDELLNVNAVRTSTAWREVLELSDEIKGMLYY